MSGSGDVPEAKVKIERKARKHLRIRTKEVTRAKARTKTRIRGSWGRLAAKHPDLAKGKRGRWARADLRLLVPQVAERVQELLRTPRLEMVRRALEGRHPALATHCLGMTPEAGQAPMPLLKRRELGVPGKRTNRRVGCLARAPLRQALKGMWRALLRRESSSRAIG
jgi:hypothetical protein